MMRKAPQYLYYYMRNRLDRILDILLHRRIYFSDPSKYNDPYDCALGIQFPNPAKLTPSDENDWKEYLIHVGIEGSDHPTPELYAKEAEKFIREEQHKDIGVIQSYKDEVRTVIKSLGKEMGVLSVKVLYILLNVTHLRRDSFAYLNAGKLTNIDIYLVKSRTLMTRR